MSNLRPQPQAKYKLLLENAQPPVNPKRYLIIFIMMLSVIGATAIAVFLAWESLSSVQDARFLSRMVEISKHQTVPTGKWQNLIYLYGVALRNNVNSSSWVLPIPLVPPLDENDKAHAVTSESFKLVCYYVIPISKRDLQPKKIDPTLCTHINIGFASVENATLHANSPGDMEVYKQVVALKLANPSLKVLLSIGGASTSLGSFAVMVSSQSMRYKFINSSLSLLTEIGLDGLDFDWEFPAWQSDSLERSYFSQLLKELREEIDKQKLSLLVSVAVAAPQPIVDQAYDVPAMAKYVDFVNVMTYDFHFYVWYLPLTGLNAPLYAREEETGYLRTLNANFTAQFWISKGMPANKIVIGLPTYGHSFTLVNGKNHGLSAPASGNGAMGRDGFISYVDACWFLTEGLANGVFDIETKAPYAYRGQEWISYDDEHSLAYKAEFVTTNHYGGAMIFSLNMDDHAGQCSGGEVSFPLTRQVANTLQDDQL